MLLAGPVTMTRWCHLGGLLCLAACRRTDIGPAGPGLHDGLVHYVGRFDFSQPGTARFEWPGTGVVARFEGTGVTALLSQSPMGFEVVVDHGAPRTVSFDGHHHSVELASGLAPGAHTVELYRRGEALWGVSGFEGLLVTEGKLLPPPPPPTRRIEFIGDSIFAGYGNEGCPFSPATQNEYLTAPAVTARALGAEHTTLAWTGLGVVRDYEGHTEEQMPVRVERTLPSRADSRWDFSRWTPDVVVIDLGDNDYELGDPPQFVPAYLDFLAALREHYPKAYVFCTMGPMQAYAAWRAKLNEVVAARHALGDTRVAFFEFSHDDGSRGLGCEDHPLAVTDGRMAEELVPVIKSTMGW
jgi:hypothetical protein